MITVTRRHAAIGALTFALGAIAVMVGIAAPSHTVRAQTNPLQLQPPAACACAAAVPVFGGSGGAQISHCQCGALSCAAATGAGGVVLQCSR